MVAILATLPAAEIAQAAAPVIGTVLWVIDGDTYQVLIPGTPEGETVRARHFDTPEKGDRARCAAEREKADRATAEARRLLPRGAIVLLSDLDRDRYGRLLATIRLPDGSDLASHFVGAGLAVPYEGGLRANWCRPFRRGHRYGRKAKGLSAPRASMGKRRPQAAVVRGRDAPKIRKRIATRPPGFGSYPARPLTHDFATPMTTTRKRFAGQRGIGPQGGPDGKESSMARQYHTLLLLDRGIWCPEFGDYDQATVQAERDDYHQGGGYDLQHLRIITTGDSQAAITAAVAKLNEEG